jgi:hypothetical protein
LVPIVRAGLEHLGVGLAGAAAARDRQCPCSNEKRCGYAVFSMRESF